MLLREVGYIVKPILLIHIDKAGNVYIMKIISLYQLGIRH
jgi:hypothetical protein